MGNVSDRYARAITSSNLRVQARTPGDADVLIASGLAARKLSKKGAASLASMLYRVRIEYDKVDKRSLARRDVNITNVLLALTHVRSLMPVRDALRAFVRGQAWREAMELDEETLHRIADQVLEYFLDPVCGTCNGTKFKVVVGTGRLSGVVCANCLGSGKRVLFHHQDARAEEYRLSDAVKDAVLRKMHKFDQRVGNLLRW
jgi:hypothetical protein